VKVSFGEFLTRAKKAHGDRYDYSLVEPEWGGIKHKIPIICREHGVFRQAPEVHARGFGCMKCRDEKATGRTPFPFAGFLVKARGVHGDRYGYDEASYQGMAKRVRIRCNEHGWFEQAAIDHTNKGRGCRLCGLEYTASQKRITKEEFIRRSNEVHGNKYDYSQAEYVNTSKNVVIVCLEHGPFKKTPTVHMAGQGCPKCSFEDMSQRFTIDTAGRVAKLREVYGDRYDYSLVNDKGGLLTPLTLICPEHGQFKTRMHDWTGCPACAKLSSRARQRQSFIERAMLVHKGFYGYEKVEYVGYHFPVTFVCPVHGDYTQTPAGHINGNRCPRCSCGRMSRLECEIFDFVASLEPSAVQGSRSVIPPYEVDIHCPTQQIAIEVNGLYWHASNSPNRGNTDEEWPRRHMLDKTLQCGANGVRLVHYYEDEWNFRQEQVKQHIRSVLGLLGPGVGARQCRVAPVTPAEASAFYEAHHIQGGLGLRMCAATTLGLYDKADVLVAAMSFTSVTSARGVKGDPRHWELVRYATATPVTGGASKLLARFLRQTPEAETVVSYSDRRISQGNLYKALGFAHTGHTQPDYAYVAKDRRIHKSAYRKGQIKTKHPDVYDPALTEREMTEKLGLHRIYNCGLDKWELRVKPC
jgi:hypothetical protein